MSMETETAPRVACLVLGYNGRDITLESLASLARMTYPNFELFYVDNGSTDDSCEAVAQAFPDVTQIRVEQNEGPTKGLNAGLLAALEGDFDYLLSLNNDIEVHLDMLTELVRVAESDPEAACVGPKSYYYGDRQRLWSAGGIIRFREFVTRERGMGRIDRGQFNRDEEVDYINGCAILMRRSMVERTGVWDPLFNFAVEDADWCMRAKQLGGRCLYAHRALLWHRVSHTAGAYQARRTFYTGRANSLFARRYGSPWQKLTVLLFSLATLPLAFLRELPKGNQDAAVAKARGLWTGLRERLTDPPGPVQQS